MPIIFRDCGEAIHQAKALAAQHNQPHTVWRAGDRFAAYPEGRNPHSDLCQNLASPITVRPVATYDPDGTEHC